MSQQTLQERFKDISQKLEKATADNPMVSVLISALCALFETQNNQLEAQSNQLEAQSIQLKEQKILIEKLNYAIEELTAKLGNKSITADSDQYFF